MCIKIQQKAKHCGYNVDTQLAKNAYNKTTILEYANYTTFIAENSVISYLENTGIFDRYLRCLRNKRKDPSHKCVELEEFSAFCTTPRK